MVNWPVTSLMPSFLASAVEKDALAPDSSTVTARAAPVAVSAGSTACFKSSADTSVPLTAGMTFGLPSTRRTVALRGLVSTTLRIAGSALLRSFSASSTGASAPFCGAKVSEAAIIAGVSLNVPALPALTFTSAEIAGLATLASTCPASSSVTSGSTTSAGTTTGCSPR